MSNRRVLSVGQCGFDHGKISRHLGNVFGVQVLGADTFDEALTVLRCERFDLVLVNRVSDLDGARGLDLIRAMKAHPALAGVPVMLVSNYPDVQKEAQAIGALAGFGKGDLTSEQTTARLRAVLAARPPDA
jgi:two-component system chemotaxis response regulator CheY